MNVVERLKTSREITHNIRHHGLVRELPSRASLQVILDGLCAALFPTHFGQALFADVRIDDYVAERLGTVLPLLHEQIQRSLQFDLQEPRDDQSLKARAKLVLAEFEDQLPVIRGRLVSDFRAAYRNDPAAESIAEIVLCYRGTIAIIYHRFAQQLYASGARLISDIAHSDTGIDIHPAAQIGGSFFIDHGTGVVIGETAVIGQHVRLYQAVTLGARRFPADATGALIKGNARHPIVEDDVVIYAGATILGRITIGRGSTIGGNVWLTQDVAPGSNVSQADARSNCPE